MERLLSPAQCPRSVRRLELFAISIEKRPLSGVEQLETTGWFRRSAPQQYTDDHVQLLRCRGKKRRFKPEIPFGATTAGCTPGLLYQP